MKKLLLLSIFTMVGLQAGEKRRIGPLHNELRVASSRLSNLSMGSAEYWNTLERNLIPLHEACFYSSKCFLCEKQGPEHRRQLAVGKCLVKKGASEQEIVQALTFHRAFEFIHELKGDARDISGKTVSVSADFFAKHCKELNQVSDYLFQKCFESGCSDCATDTNKDKAFAGIQGERELDNLNMLVNDFTRTFSQPYQFEDEKIISLLTLLRAAKRLNSNSLNSL